MPKLLIKDRVKETTTTTGTGTVTLAGAVSGFQSFGAVGDGNQCYYAIVHQTLAEWEAGIGTYTASGTTLSRDTVLASSNSGSAVNFSSGTKDVWVNLPADFPSRLHHTAAYGSIPTAGQAGRLFLPSDGVSIYRDSGTAWVPWGPIWPLTDPSLAGFSWTNQGGASVSSANGGESMTVPSGSGDNLRQRLIAVPSKPYSITARVHPTFNQTNYWGSGLCWSDGTKLATFGLGFSTEGKLAAYKWTNATTFSATYKEEAADRHWFPFWLRITDDSSNRKCFYSHDGVNWLQYHSVATNDFLTPTHVGWFGNNNGTGLDGYSTLLSWKQG